MCKIWGQPEGERISVLFNENGQPIKNNSHLSHFLGTLARNGKYAPLNYSDWLIVPDEFKNDMMALVMVCWIDYCFSYDIKLFVKLYSINML